MDKCSFDYRAGVVALVKDEEQPQKCWQSITLRGLRIRDSTHSIDEQSLGESYSFVWDGGRKPFNAYILFRDTL